MATSDQHQPNGQQPSPEHKDAGEDAGGGGTAGAGGSASTASSRSSTSSVKSVYLYRNGDKFAPAKKIVLNPRQLRDWDVFLEQATQSVNPVRGAVRNIVTPRRGRRRMVDFDSLEDKGHYVALSNGEKFKPMPYVPEDDATGTGSGQHHHEAAESPGVSPRRNLVNNRVVLEPIRPVVHNKKLMTTQPRFTSQMDVISAQSKSIRIYRNGDEFTPAIIILLKPSEQTSMDTVIKAVEERVVLPSNRAIRKLYDMSGHRIWDPKNIEHEKFYVASGHEPFTARPYGQKLPVLIVGKADRTSTIKYLAGPVTPAKESSRRPKEGQGKQSNRVSKAQKEQAASHIQASIRGFQTRKETAEKQAAKPISIKPDQANSKENQPPKQQQQQQQKQQPQKQQQQQQQPQKQQKQQQQQPQKQQPSKEDQDRAATVIQSSVRGFETRKAAAEKSANKPIEVKPDQANSKASSPPKQQQQQQQQQQQTQKKDEPKKPQQQQEQEQKKTPSKEEQDKAATVIQSAVKGHQSRKDAADKMSSSSGAKQQQQQQQQQQQKQQPEEKKEQQKSQPTPQELDKAATTIQAAYKGHTARKAAVADASAKQKQGEQQQQQQQQQQPKKELTPTEQAASENIAAAVNSYKTRKDAAKGEAKATTTSDQKQPEGQQQQTAAAK